MEAELESEAGSQGHHTAAQIPIHVRNIRQHEVVKHKVTAQSFSFQQSGIAH